MATTECGCHADCPRCGTVKVEFCPLHAAAGELLNALNNTAKLAHKNIKNHNTWLSFRECSHATCKAASEAIRKAGE
jgi:hypothetical protein